MKKLKIKFMIVGMSFLVTTFPVNALEVLENDNYIYLNRVPLSKEFLSVLYQILNINLFIILGLIGGVLLILLIYSFLISLINKAGIFNYFGLIFNYIRPKRYWGIVFDDRSLSPVNLARVRLIEASIDPMSLSKKVIATTLTNFQGRYFFKVDLRNNDNYFIEVNAIGYTLFYKPVEFKSKVHKNANVVFDVPMKKIIKGNNIFKAFFGYYKNLVYKLGYYILLLLSLAGVIVSVYKQVFLISITSFAFIGLFSLISFVLIYRFFHKYTLKKIYVVESLLMERIPGAVVRMYDQDKVQHLCITNKKGEVLLDWTPGMSEVLVTKRGFEILDEVSGTSGAKRPMTYNKYVKMKRLDIKEETSAIAVKEIKVKDNLRNPFSTFNY